VWEIELHSISPPLLFKGQTKMNEKKYNKRLESQSKLISRQSEQIESLNVQIAKLKLEIEEKDNIISSVASLKDELIQKNKDIDKYKEEYRKLINEIRQMKEIFNQEIYKGRWWLVKFLIK
jgi:septal ring factor EnvC (AmiA/AmiB activator)